MTIFSLETPAKNRNKIKTNEKFLKYKKKIIEKKLTKIE